MIGQVLGPYHMLTKLGEGGMGAVYKARDTRLDRFVAIKVLSGDLASSPEARERFEREARTISQLSHPHICALFDVGRHDEIEFLVMELLEGETLAARLSRGAVPMDQALRYGIEIADALHAAHRNGIVHRDLKPANVMLTKSGVKLLDFGLAKTAAPLLAGSVPDAETAMGLAQISQEGAIVGTLQYMSPEQLEGRPADARSDIFAFGAVLHEMVTGRKAFTATSPIALASAILHHQPPALTSLQPATPSALDRLVRVCLAKDPEDRWQSAHDLRLQLVAIQEGSSDVAAPQTVATPRHRLRVAAVAAVLGAIVAAGLTAASMSMLRRPALPAGGPARFLLTLPPFTALPQTVETVPFAVSADGSSLALIGIDAQGHSRVWLRSLASVDARALPGTEGANGVFWSPDSRSLGFFAGNKLKRVDVQSGAVVPLCDVRETVGKSGTWSRNGQILFAAIEGEAIYRTSTTAGGAPTVELRPDRGRGETRVVWPSFLPDGNRFLYLVRREDGRGALMMGESGKPPRELMPLDSVAAYVEPGFLVFVREGVLLGQRFDAASARVSGEPFSIADPVRHFFSSNWSAFSISPMTIAYEATGAASTLAWFDSSGRELAAVGTPAENARVHLSIDARVAVFDRARAGLGTMDIWSVDLARGLETRLTSHPDTESAALLLPDGHSLIFGSTRRGGPPNLMRRDLNSGSEDFLFPQGRLLQLAEDVSADGKVLLFAQRAENGAFDLWTMSPSGSPAPAPLVNSPADELGGRFSPDGRYVAFASNESGRFEAYIAAVASPGARTRISTSGASPPRWSRDSGELFFVSGDEVVKVSVRTSPALDVGRPVPLFRLPPGRRWSSFDVSPDGKRLLAIVPEGPGIEQRLTVVLNWQRAIQ